MTVLDLETYDSDVLRGSMSEVDAIDDEVRSLVADMEESMYAHSGVGLAAPQIGVSKQITVMDCGQKRDGSESICMINPEILETEGDLEGDEGCLSLPGIWGDPHRCQYAKVKFLTPEGNEQVIEREGLWARCIQHEVDHLQGTLFIDHLSGDQKERAEQRFRALSEWERHPEERIKDSGMPWGDFVEGEGKYASFNRKQYTNTLLPSTHRSFFESLDQPLHIVAVTELPNFESGYVVPVMARVAEASEAVRLRILPVDEHRDLRDYYLTYGHSGCPLLVFFDDTFTERGVWGPRPEEAEALLEKMGNDGISKSDQHRRLRSYYEKHGIADLLDEVTTLLKQEHVGDHENLASEEQ